MLKIGLIGCGFMGSMHANCYNNIKDARVVAVADLRRDKAEELAKISDATIYETGRELIEHADVDAIDICLPTYLHAEYAVAAMEKVKYLFVEKPVALTVADCGRILEAERRTGKLCAPICQLRCSEVFRQLKEQIDAGAFGKLILGSLSMKYYRSPEYYAGSWRGTKRMDGGGAVETVHC